MFYNRGEVISDQFDHLKVIRFRVLVVLFWMRKKPGKTGLFGNFFFEGGGGVSYSQMYMSEY